MVSTNEIIVNQLEPQSVFKLFAQLSNIPRPSKKEERVRQWLQSLASEHEGWIYTEDKVGNVVIRVPASEPRFESSPGVIIQGHIDMVCEADECVNHNFDEDPIQLKVDGEWLRATGTTLGSDNGIGCCVGLAIAMDKNVTHGPLELLFTIDEEEDMTGATMLKETATNGFLTGKYLINLDTEEDGILYIGCAGSQDTVGKFTCVREESVPEDALSYKIKISGLLGGHSGVDINKGCTNANKILARVLGRMLDANIPFGLVSLNGGRKRNAIPREASAIVYLSEDARQKVLSLVEEVTQKSEFCSVDPDLRITVESHACTEKPFSLEDTTRLVNVMYALPNGVIRMSPDIENFVETSTNFGVIITTGNEVEFATMQRSSNYEALVEIVNTIRRIFELSGFSWTMDAGLSPWQPEPQSELLSIAKESYKYLRGREAEVQCIHAALECGLILDALPDITCISYGPTIEGAHSPSERLRIADVKPCYEMTVDLLRRITEL